jgi:site-specific recombinase XerD
MDKSMVSATTTISVFTRHSPECSKREDPAWKRCKCRKYLYIYEDGRARRVSAKTRSWEKAMAIANSELAQRDPVALRLQEIAAAEIASQEAEAAKQAKRTLVLTALTEWQARKDNSRISSVITRKTFLRKVLAWAKGQGIQYMDEVPRRALDQWSGKWSPDAADKYDRMGSRTSQQFQSRLQEFFGWASDVEIIAKNPSAALKPIKVTEEQTMPLDPEQFQQLLASCPMYDSARQTEEDYRGVELRSLFLVMRWTGLRISDVLMLPRSALNGNRLRLITQKTHARYDEIVPDIVITELASIRPRPGVHPDYFFWSRTCTPRTLSSTWCMRINELNEFLSFRDEQGQPMRFRSHMLRDTFAVEMLLDPDIRLEDVSRMLTHKSIAVTQRHYAPFVERRIRKLEERKVEAMKRMGATFTI